MHRIAHRFVAALLGIAVTLVGSHARAAEAEPLRVLAAASLTEVIAGLAERFEGNGVKPSFGASSELARQIRDGAPADVFVSASPEWIDFLREAQAIAGDATVIA